MMRNFLILDVATAPIADAGSYVEPVSAPANYRDPEKIAAWKAEKAAERLDGAALDVDLCRIIGVGVYGPSFYAEAMPIAVCRNPDDERRAFAAVVRDLSDGSPTIITYGGFNFDLPVLMRRARYLGVDFPKLNLDRYRSPHIDLCELLSDRDPKRRRPLGFYVKRLGWTDLVKPLDGAEESRVPETGKWGELAASIRHDVTATYRLAQWLGVIPFERSDEQQLALTEAQ